MTCAGTVPAALVVVVTGDVLVVETVVEVGVETVVEVGVEVVVAVETVVAVEGVVEVVVDVGVDPPHEVAARRAAHTTYRPRVRTACGVDDMFRCHHPPG